MPLKTLRNLGEDNDVNSKFEFRLIPKYHDVLSNIGDLKELYSIHDHLENSFNEYDRYNIMGLGHCLFYDYNNAIEYFNESIKIEPMCPYAYMYRSIAHIKNDNAAVSDLSKAIMFKTDNLEAYYLRASLYYDMGKFERAIEDYTFIINAEPGSYTAIFNRANCYYFLDQFDKASMEYSQLDDYLANMYLGMSLVENHEYEKGIEAYTDIMELYGDNSFLDKRAFCYFKLGEYIKAIEDYTADIISLEEMIKSEEKFTYNEELIEDYKQRANCYLKLKDYLNAEKDQLRIGELEAIFNADPNNCS